MITYLSIVLGAWTVINMWLAGNKNQWAWVSGIASQAVWLVFDFYAEAWGLMPLGLILTVIYYRNWRAWRSTIDKTV